MKTILVPTDFSDAAKAAIEVAATIASKEKACLILLHAIELPSTGSFNVAGEVLTTDNWEEKIYSMKVIEGAKQRLERLSAELNKSGINTRHQLKLGSPFVGIREIITSEAVDLVVMGANGHSKLE